MQTEGEEDDIVNSIYDMHVGRTLRAQRTGRAGGRVYVGFTDMKGCNGITAHVQSRGFIIFH